MRKGRNEQKDAGIGTFLKTPEAASRDLRPEAESEAESEASLAD